MNNAYYGRRRSVMPQACAMPTPYGARRTANNGVCYDAVGVAEDPICGNMVLAMAYVLMQQFESLYEIEEGFDRGTVVPELDKPFMGGGCRVGL